MRIKITSICSEQTLRPLNAFYTKLEDALNAYMGGMSFGSIDLFMISIVSAFDDNDENCKFSAAENKTGSFVDPFTKDKIKFITIGLAYPPSKVLLLSELELRQDLCDEILSRFMREPIPGSGKFDLENFLKEFKVAIEIYKRSTV